MCVPCLFELRPLSRKVKAIFSGISVRVHAHQLMAVAASVCQLFLYLVHVVFTGELEASVSDYSTVLQIETDHVEATFHRGTVYEKLGKLDEAIQDFSKVLSLEPDHVKASYARGTCRNLKGDFAPAIGKNSHTMKAACIKTEDMDYSGCLCRNTVQPMVNVTKAHQPATTCLDDALVSCMFHASHRTCNGEER